MKHDTFESSKQDLWLMIAFRDIANILPMSLGSTITMLFEEQSTPKSCWIWCPFFFGSLRGNGGYLNANNHCQLVFYDTKVPLDFPWCSKYILFIYAQAVYLMAPMEATFLLVHINDMGYLHTSKIFEDNFCLTLELLKDLVKSKRTTCCNKEPQRPTILSLPFLAYIMKSWDRRLEARSAAMLSLYIV